MAGVIEELLVEDGSTVQPGNVVLRIRVGASGGAAKPKPTETKPPSQAEAPVDKPAAPQEPSSKPLSTSPVSSVKSSVDSLPGSSDIEASGSNRKETRVKTSRMRQRIAQRLKDAQNTYAMLTTFNEIDMRFLLEYFKLIFNDFHLFSPLPCFFCYTATSWRCETNTKIPS